MRHFVCRLALAAALTAGCSLFSDLGGFSSDEAETPGGPGGDEAGAGGEAGGGGGPGGGDGGSSEPPPGPPKWRLVSSTGPARHSSTIAYDENRQRIVLFGGWVGANKSDTWEWDGVVWSQRTLPESPSGRRGHRMVHDTARKTVFLYGGTRGDVTDQWSWDGTRWRAATSVAHPPSYQNLGMAYDSDRGVVVIFGGNHYAAAGGASMLDETWQWNGSDWAKVTPSLSPSARRGHTMGYDAARKRVVLFGGKATNIVYADTWEFDGATWVMREPIDFPSKRAGACMAYDPRRQIVVMFGGAVGRSNSGETWHWDGNNWSAGAAGPSPRRSCAMAWDPARKAIVMFGGRVDDESASPETWVYE